MVVRFTVDTSRNEELSQLKPIFSCGHLTFSITQVHCLLMGKLLMTVGPTKFFHINLRKALILIWRLKKLETQVKMQFLQKHQLINLLCRSLLKSMMKVQLLNTKLILVQTLEDFTLTFHLEASFTCPLKVLFMLIRNGYTLSFKLVISL